MKVNLPVLLAQRRITISDLHRATGISRTTLNSLYHERSKGVKFETLEKICKELDCSLDELFEVEKEDYIA